MPLSLSYLSGVSTKDIGLQRGYNLKLTQETTDESELRRYVENVMHEEYASNGHTIFDKIEPRAVEKLIYIIINIEKRFIDNV